MSHTHRHDESPEHPRGHNDHSPGHGHDHGCCGGAAVVTLPATLEASRTIGNAIRTQIRILQMDCPTEEALIRKKLEGAPAVVSMEFNLIQRVLTVLHTKDGLPTVLDDLRALGFSPQMGEDGVLPAADSEAGATSTGWSRHWPLVLSAVAALAAEAVGWLGLPQWAAALLALAAVLGCGLGTYKKGWIALRNGNLNINALMSIAVTGALLLGQWPEAAMVMVLFTVAELIEARSVDRARNAIQGLTQLAPDRATVLQADGSWSETPAAAVPVGAIVRVRPGERVSLDGEITSGRSTVNQAPITGESLPVEKAEGNAVFAGTINESGAFEYRVTAAAGNTTLARIIHTIEAAQGAKAPTQRFVDRFARIYTPIVFLVALAVAVIPPLFLAQGWFEWIYKALVLLVIACPCALVISTPVSIVSGLAAAARRGILVKGGTYLEQGRNLSWLALDKTGTITHGKPVQTDFELLAGTDDGAQAARVHALAASLAGRSDHPVSTAVARAAQDDGIALIEVDDFEAIPGRGVRGVVDGTRYALGNHRLTEELGRCSPALEQRLDALERQGKTVVVLMDEARALALFAVADTVKKSSREAIAQLHALGIRTLMLSGDNSHTAKAIAGQVGIDRAEGNQLPEDKLQAVEGLATGGGMVGMVGDGINDAPALARADVGFAMGALGTDAAIETADVALMDDDLRKIPAFIRLSRATHAVLVQNILLALVIKAVFLGLTLAGLGTMWMAVFADVGASLLVVSNGLRLLRK